MLIGRRWYSPKLRTYSTLLGWLTFSTKVLLLGSIDIFLTQRSMVLYVRKKS